MSCTSLVGGFRYFMVFHGISWHFNFQLSWTCHGKLHFLVATTRSRSPECLAHVLLDNPARRVLLDCTLDTPPHPCRVCRRVCLCMPYRCCWPVLASMLGGRPLYRGSNRNPQVFKVPKAENAQPILDSLVSRPGLVQKHCLGLGLPVDISCPLFKARETLQGLNQVKSLETSGHTESMPWALHFFISLGTTMSYAFGHQNDQRLQHRWARHISHPEVPAFHRGVQEEWGHKIGRYRELPMRIWGFKVVENHDFYGLWNQWFYGHRDRTRYCVSNLIWNVVWERGMTLLYIWPFYAIGMAVRQFMAVPG